MSIAALVLAGGGSLRFGSPKQLARLEGESLVERAAGAALASRCEPVWVVLGAHAEAVAAAVRDLDVQTVHNVDWEEGLASSIRTGIDAAAVAHPETEALVLLLADQVRVTSELIDELVARFERGEGDLFACAFAATVGPPALFARRFLPELEALRGDQGARAILEAHADELVAVPFPEAEVDVDTPADLARLG
jgi:molybdenum cofactor cytidylyltransferase